MCVIILSGNSSQLNEIASIENELNILITRSRWTRYFKFVYSDGSTIISLIYKTFKNRRRENHKIEIKSGIIEVEVSYVFMRRMFVKTFSFPTPLEYINFLLNR